MSNDKNNAAADPRPAGRPGHQADEVRGAVSANAVRQFIADRTPNDEHRENILCGDYDHTAWFDHIRELMATLAARQPDDVDWPINVWPCGRGRWAFATGPRSGFDIPTKKEALEEASAARKAALAKRYAKEDVFEAYKTWPADLKAKLSVNDLRRTNGWTPRTNVDDWRIDTSAGGPILIYKDCSVIEGEDARYVLALIQKDQRPVCSAADGKEWCGNLGSEHEERQPSAYAERIRLCIQSLLEWVDRHAETTEESGFYKLEQEAVEVMECLPAHGIDLERARDEGHDGAIRYVLGYLNGVGDWGSTQYVEILNACGRERIIRSAVQDGELEFTGLGRWVAERGTDEDRALIDIQRDAAVGVGNG